MALMHIVSELHKARRRLQQALANHDRAAEERSAIDVDYWERQLLAHNAR